MRIHLLPWIILPSLASSASFVTNLPFGSNRIRTTRTTSSRIQQQQQQQRANMSSSSSSSTTMRTTQLPPVSKRIQRTLDPCVVLMKDLIGQHTHLWKDKGGIYSLAQGVVYWRPPPSTQAALLAALSPPDNDDDDENASDLHLYGPDEGLDTLREKLQEKIQSENGLHHHDVLVTVGANQAYVNCVLTLLSDTDKAVVFAPYYFNHVMALQMTLPEEGLVVGPSSAAGIPDLDWLAQRLADDPTIRMVTLVNPGNPTGTLLSRDDVLQRAVDLCRDHACWLVLDNTYEYFVPKRFDGCFADPHVLHIFSLSKSYALAGYRCGYVVMSKHAPVLANQMIKVQDTIPIAPSRISQIAALGALEAGRDWVAAKVETLDTGREAILQALAPLEQVMGGSGAMYVMGKLPHNSLQSDEDVATRLVRDFGIAVIPGSFCGSPGWIRVCYANLPPEQCKEAAARLAKGLQVIVDECG